MTTKNFRKTIDRVFIGVLAVFVIALGYIMLDNARFSTYEENPVGYLEIVKNGFGDVVDVEIHTYIEMAGL